MPYIIPNDVQQLLNELHSLQTEMDDCESELIRLQNYQDKIRVKIAAAEIPSLRAEKDSNEEKIARLKERQHYYKSELKIREAQMNELRRKQRNRRIFTRGGMLEAFLIEPLLMTDEQVHDFLFEVFRMPEVDSLLRKVLDRCHEKFENSSEGGTENEGI